MPTPLQRVKVCEAGWETSRVVPAHMAGADDGDEFDVFTHHLKQIAP